MNFDQGMRRLATFGVVLGAAAGGAYAHRDLRNVPSERYQRRVFEKLTVSNIVMRPRAMLLSARANDGNFDLAK